jgi:hypothetical protein
MSLRDKHMRAYVFTTPEGEMPDLRFTAGEAACTAGKREEHTCVFTGELTIRETARPLVVTVRLSRENGAVRAVAAGTVRLSAYGIDRPSQLGVVAEDEVPLHFFLVSTPLAKESKIAGGTRIVVRQPATGRRVSNPTPNRTALAFGRCSVGAQDRALIVPRLRVVRSSPQARRGSERAANPVAAPAAWSSTRFRGLHLRWSASGRRGRD